MTRQASMTRLIIVCVTVIVMAMLKHGQCAPDADKITFLPGLAKQPPFKQYSGFLQATGTKQHHYWFVESYDDPSRDPIVLWLNGGPGCSSLIGLLKENGPFTVQDDATLSYNPYSWNMNANVLYMESPVGVGYSYSQDKNYTTNDDEVTLDNLSALKDFFTKFPEYNTSTLYLTGESYGGYYIPLLADKMLQQFPSWNLQGIAVGNGMSDLSIDINAMFYFAYYHGLIGASLWVNLIDTCCAGKETRCNFTANTQAACVTLKNEAQTMVLTSGLDIYNIYSECYPSASGMTFDPQTGRYTLQYYGNFLWDIPVMAHQKQLFAKVLKDIPFEKLDIAVTCGNDTALITYLNSATVRKALHIDDDLPPWSVCSVEVGSAYQTLYTTMKAQYLRIIAAKKRILVYNGDTDIVCCYLADEWFVDGLNQKLIEKRKPWYYKEADGTTQVGGFVQQYDNLVFTTIKGSGHFVPMDKPIQAFAMIQKFLQNKPF